MAKKTTKSKKATKTTKAAATSPAALVATTIYGWQKELGIDGDTIRRKLAKIEYRAEPNELIPARVIINALLGEKEAAMIRKTNAEAEALERENKEADGMLVEMPTAEKEIWQELLLPLKVEVETLADKVAALVNPENPGHAHAVLSDWAEEVKKRIKEKAKTK